MAVGEGPQQGLSDKTQSAQEALNFKWIAHFFFLQVCPKCDMEHISTQIIICCLSEILIELSVLYFYLQNVVNPQRTAPLPAEEGPQLQWVTLQGGVPAPSP